MRILFYVALFIVVLLACETREPEPIVVPSWIKSQLVELQDSGSCDGCRLQRWTYREEHIYHLYCNDESCLDCGYFHNNGTPVEWGITINHADFDSTRYRPTIVWECGDELDF